MANAKQIIKQAKQWLGKKESDGSHKEIIDVYNAHKPLARSYKVQYTDAWCATFVSAVAIKCGATDIIPTECSCAQQIKKFKELGCWVENENRTPKPGDIIYYDWDDNGQGDNTGHPDHVGIIEQVVGKTISVIEGNISNRVGRRLIYVNSSKIRGYATPKYIKKEEDKVKLKAGATYYDGTKIPSWVFEKELYVRKIKDDKVIVSIYKTGAITGVVKATNVEKI